MCASSSEDDRRQTERARSFIEKQVDREEALFVSDIVLAELVWVRSVSYKRKRAEIAAVLGELVRARHLAFQSTDRIFRALRAYAVGAGDFADYMIREEARSAGCKAVATFDDDLLAEEGFLTLA